MSDPDLKKILSKKEAEGVAVIYHNRPDQKLLRTKVSGLYHKKILIIDRKEVYLGSANCTTPSLSFAGNQIIGFSDPQFIKAMINNNSYRSKNIECYLLPNKKKEALAALLKSIKEAKKRIVIAMYAFTHKSIIQELISASKRGVKVEIYLDEKMAKSTCKKFLTPLQTACIPLFRRTKHGLLHHKSALIDNLFISGSANWSSSGFGKNEETFLLVKNLTEKEQKIIARGYKNIKYFSHPLDLMN